MLYYCLALAGGLVTYILIYSRMKIVIVLNRAATVTKGELALLASRATVQSYAKSSQANRVSYFLTGQTKITLKADNMDQIHQEWIDS